MTCPVSGCDRSRRHGHLMCGTCWYRVPINLRREVWWTFGKLRNGGGSEHAIKRYGEAVNAALQAVEQS